MNQLVLFAGNRAPRQPHLSRDGRDRLPEKRRHAGARRADGEPCLDAHDAALRSESRGGHARRGGAGVDLIKVFCEQCMPIDRYVSHVDQGEFAGSRTTALMPNIGTL
jgi:hypothetical protein